MVRFFAISLMILFAASTRLMPHPWNFTAIAAMGLFGGALFASKKESFFIPIVALFLSDCFLGFHSTMVFVYGALLLTVILGWNLKNHRSAGRLTLTAVSSSFVFFGITNFGVWLIQDLYPKTASGLAESYVAAIPFLGNQIAGDLFYTALLFSAYEVLSRQVPALASQKK